MESPTPLNIPTSIPCTRPRWSRSLSWFHVKGRMGLPFQRFERLTGSNTSWEIGHIFQIDFDVGQPFSTLQTPQNISLYDIWNYGYVHVAPISCLQNPPVCAGSSWNAFLSFSWRFQDHLFSNKKLQLGNQQTRPDSICQKNRKRTPMLFPSFTNKSLQQLNEVRWNQRMS